MNPEVTIYVDRCIDRAFVVSLLQSVHDFRNPVENHDEMETPLAKIIVEKNTGSSNACVRGAGDEFLRYPSRLVIEARQVFKPESPIRLSANDILFDPRGYEPYIAFVSELLQAFWKMGIPAVAACDFENMLPANGGLNRTQPESGSP